MFFYMTLVLLATVDLAAAACSTSAVVACSKPFTSADSSDLKAMCRGAATTTACLAPKTADCTGEFIFDSLTNSMNTMKGVCHGPNSFEGFLRRRKREAESLVDGIKKIMV